LSQVANLCKKTKDELTSRNHINVDFSSEKEEFTDGYMRGVEDTSKKLTKEIINHIIEEIY